MNLDRWGLLNLLGAVERGEISADQALTKLAAYPYEDIGEAQVDHQRLLRNGTSEVIFGQGKTPEQLVAIFAALQRSGQNVLATRCSPEQFAAVRQAYPAAYYHELARTITLQTQPRQDGKGLILVIAAGTCDLPVAEEARMTADFLGNQVASLIDVGVAGLHRLLAHIELLRQARVVIVCAGMEGALPSVVGGLVSAPVIAVPTSVGYGSAFGGVTALLSMLNSCSPNICTVNIDNGFGAGYLASMMNHL